MVAWRHEGARPQVLSTSNTSQQRWETSTPTTVSDVSRINSSKIKRWPGSWWDREMTMSKNIYCMTGVDLLDVNNPFYTCSEAWLVCSCQVIHTIIYSILILACQVTRWFWHDRVFEKEEKEGRKKEGDQSITDEQLEDKEMGKFIR